MQTPLKTLVPFLAAGTMLLGQALAQDTPASTTTKPAQSSSTPSGTTTKTPTTKTPAAKKPATATGTKPATGATLTTQKSKSSYALGMSIGSGLKKQGVATAVDPATVARGLRDAMSGSKTALTEDEMKAALQQLRGDVEK